MIYKKIVKGKFIDRPNRFVAICKIAGEEINVHVKNTGRCKELLVPGANVFLEDFVGRMGKRKMRYSLIAVEKGNLLINMDSQAPNKVVEEALNDGKIKLDGMEKLLSVIPERTYGDSRLDFFVEDEKGQKGFVEVKGVTLEKNGIAMFPDAPTLRGIKHIEELAKASKEGYKAYILFVIQMEGMTRFKTNDKTHADFGKALKAGVQKGVEVLVFDCVVRSESLNINERIRMNI